MTSSAPPPDPIAVAVFARAPVPGRVKTRVARAVGDEAAARLHERLVGRALATARAAGLDGVELWCEPDASHPFFERCAREHGVELHAQQGADLGARMAHAFASAQARGRRLVLIGSDCPALEPGDLRDASAALAAYDAVFAPAEDGGYVLVALARPCAALFDAVAWGGEGVMQRTRELAAAAGVRVKELRRLWDVDRPADLERLERLEREGALR
jgi:rSAM/selenodomain-associated transferase 1